jgi:NTP pyrophosphatase (non-canonical NTP hydrolase)
MKTFAEYQVEVMRTASAQTGMEALLVRTLGLVGEVGEVVELILGVTVVGRPLDKDAFTKELGDVLWYIAALFHWLDESNTPTIVFSVVENPDVRPLARFFDFSELVSNGMRLTATAGLVADLVKKFFGHGAPLDKNRVLANLHLALVLTRAIADLVGVPLSVVAEKNIAKLRARYPQGFSAEASKARLDETARLEMVEVPGSKTGLVYDRENCS